MQKTVGTFCDDYKLNMFLDEFKAANVMVLSVHNFSHKVKLIKCFGDPDTISKVCTKVQAHYEKKYTQEN